MTRGKRRGRGIWLGKTPQSLMRPTELLGAPWGWPSDRDVPDGEYRAMLYPRLTFCRMSDSEPGYNQTGSTGYTSGIPLDQPVPVRNPGKSPPFLWVDEPS